MQQQIQYTWKTAKPLAIASLILLAAIFVLNAIVKVHIAIHHIPLLAPFLQLTGFSYTFWFAIKNLLFHQKRQQFNQKLENVKLEVLGTPDPLQALPPSRDRNADRNPIILQEESELVLAKHLLQLTDVLAEVERDLYPNRLCQYLYELSQKFNQFFENCPVLKAEEPVRTSRLMLCDLTARTLKQGLSLLGISVLERM